MGSVVVVGVLVVEVVVVVVVEVLGSCSLLNMEVYNKWSVSISFG